jgi:pimeloyl-ACP methyl ester carboxylesterase
MLVTACGGALADAAVATTPTGELGPQRTPPLRWEPCGDDFECASLRVPVDYAVAGGDAVRIAVTRRPAEDPARRIGALVVNFGGPGDPGTSTLRATAGDLPPAIRRRFDLVSFDPRGSGRSRPVDCVDDETFEQAWSDDRTPDTEAELRQFYDGSAFSVDLVGDCVERFGPWLARVGTRNVARDLDRLRAALSEARLTFLGYSYGTVIGAVYAQEFPDRVRALVLDSGFERALGEFLADCRARARCAFAPRDDPAEALEELRQDLESGARIETPGGRSIGVTELYFALLAALYTPETWPFLAQALQHAAVEHDGTGLEALSDVYAGRRGDGTYSNFQEVLGVIVCDDQHEPLVSFDSFRESYESVGRDYPFFGPLLFGSPLGCDPRLPRPRADEIVGDVRTAEAPPALIVGTTRDPATPYRGAKDLRRRLAGSRLLTVEGTRHGGYALGNVCVDRIVNRYLIARQLPPPGTRCGEA